MAGLLRTIGVIAGIVAAVATAGLAVVVIGVRTRNDAFLRAFTRLQRDSLNPRVMEIAGSPGASYGVIEHVGRTSGRPYETPVGPSRDGADWVVPVVYGSQSGWVQNLLAAGEGVLRIDGERHRIDRVSLVPIITTPLATSQAGLMRLFGVTEAMRLRPASTA